jgi:hypothetical protein
MVCGVVGAREVLTMPPMGVPALALAMLDPPGWPSVLVLLGEGFGVLVSRLPKSDSDRSMRSPVKRDALNDKTQIAISWSRRAAQVNGDYPAGRVAARTLLLVNDNHRKVPGKFSLLQIKEKHDRSYFAIVCELFPF